MLFCEFGFGRAELEDRPRAKRHLRRIKEVTRTVAGAPRRAHIPEPAPRGTLSIGVEANTQTERIRRSELVAVLVKKNEYYR